MVISTALNWKEIARLCESLRGPVEGLFVDRIVVPERRRFPSGYLKGEWAIRLAGRSKGRTSEVNLVFSVRPQRPYLTLYPEKAIRTAVHATHSPFSQALSKHLKGARLLSLKVIERERWVVLGFSAGGNGTAPRSESAQLGLVIALIPALPEAFLVQLGGAQPDEEPRGWPILARSRVIRDSAKVIDVLTLPDGSKAPPELPVREEWVRSAEAYTQVIETALAEEAFQARLAAAQKAVRERAHQLKIRIEQCKTAIREAEQEPDWSRYGDLLKAVLHDPPEIRDGKREVPSYDEEGRLQLLSIPSDPKLTPQQQIQKFYQLSRRKLRKVEEARLRCDVFTGNLEKLERASALTIKPLDWAMLAELERAVGIGPEQAGSGPQPGTDRKGPGKAGGSWLGKTFVSKDGLPIWVGRSRDENLELTFKIARGNDVWLHLRGRPGAHVLVPVQPGKSVPLETLLDAALLTIFYSGGEKWGKTEVDYTFKKYVKRIRDSTEASYTHNKTLIVEVDQARLQRLLAAGG